VSAADSGNITRDYSLTVRLSSEEKAHLEQLAQRFDLDKSATVRRALQIVLADRQRLPQSGHFVALQPEAVSFPVRLRGKAAGGG
jgi:hypothetical protein